MENKIVYCGNCGKRGHIYKNCFLPIVSFGVICVRYPEINLNDILQKYKNNKYIFIDISKCKDKNLLDKISSKLKFLMICRKQTLGFAELIRGNYNLSTYHDMKYIKHLFTIMTINEIELIKDHDFDKLWAHLWCMKDSINYHQNEYNLSKEKFIKLIGGITINNTKYSLDSIINKINPIWDQPEWGFPKGRRNFREADLDCAIREFGEETSIKSDMYNVLDIHPFNEEFIGSNNVSYKHTYYLSQTYEEIPLKIDNENIHQKIEISDISWLSYENAQNKIRYYNKQKKYLLNKVYNLLLVGIYNHITNQDQHKD